MVHLYFTLAAAVVKQKIHVYNQEGRERRKGEEGVRGGRERGGERKGERGIITNSKCPYLLH